MNTTTAPMTTPRFAVQGVRLNPAHRMVLREAARFVGWMLVSFGVTALVDTVLCWLL